MTQGILPFILLHHLTFNYLKKVIKSSYLSHNVEGARDWNEEFQQLREKECDNYYSGHVEAELERIEELQKLCSEFAEVAKSVGYIEMSVQQFIIE